MYPRDDTTTQHRVPCEVTRNREHNQEEASVGKGFGWVGARARIGFHECRRFFVPPKDGCDKEREAQTYYDEGVHEVDLALGRDGSVLVHDQIALPGEVTVDELGDSKYSGERRMDKRSIQGVKERAHQPQAGGEEGEAAMQQGADSGAVAWPVLCGRHYHD